MSRTNRPRWNTTAANGDHPSWQRAGADTGPHTGTLVESSHRDICLASQHFMSSRKSASASIWISLPSLIASSAFRCLALLS